MSVEKMRALNPSDKTIALSVDTEELSVAKVKKFIGSQKLDFQSIGILLKVMNSIGRLRVNQRAEVSITAKIFRDVAKDKDELKMYIESSFPKIFDFKK